VTKHELVRGWRARLRRPKTSHRAAAMTCPWWSWRARGRAADHRPWAGVRGRASPQARRLARPCRRRPGSMICLRWWSMAPWMTGGLTSPLSRGGGCSGGRGLLFVLVASSPPRHGL